MPRPRNSNYSVHAVKNHHRNQAYRILAHHLYLHLGHPEHQVQAEYPSTSSSSSVTASSRRTQSKSSSSASSSENSKLSGSSPCNVTPLSSRATSKSSSASSSNSSKPSESSSSFGPNKTSSSTANRSSQRALYNPADDDDDLYTGIESTIGSKLFSPVQEDFDIELESTSPNISTAYHSGSSVSGSSGSKKTLNTLYHSGSSSALNRQPNQKTSTLSSARNPLGRIPTQLTESQLPISLARVKFKATQKRHRLSQEIGAVQLNRNLLQVLIKLKQASKLEDLYMQSVPTLLIRIQIGTIKILIPNQITHQNLL
ncbi:hypothetical protein SSS_08090 [Sarcoptes scabiei]|uniref:Uncharacterized protein n=1 Tax=Sarcoptes scabiei TaxID=52283 RepID=A0A834VFV3_SARSC|nr:hypothetical protein SSS_08090 [Sarcoptes scabiei]